MKRFLLWMLTSIMVIPSVLAESKFKYVGCSPASGSEISSFDFILEFNYDGIIQEKGDQEYGISYSGYYNAKRPARTKCVELYEGDRESGTFLGRTMTSSVVGTSAAFLVGNTISISFPDVIPEKGKTYNLYVSNTFDVQVKGEAGGLAGTDYINFYGTGTDMDATYNLILTYVGASGSSESLSLESTSLRPQQELDVLSAITYTFNNPVSVSADAKAQLKEGENIIATSTKFEQPDEKSVTFSFDEVELLLSHSYVLTLPEGLVSMSSDDNQKNTAFNITLNGTLTKLIELATVTPPTDEKQILSSVNASFNVPAGYKFYTPEALANKYVAKLYQSEISDDNLLASIQGVISQGNTVVWDLPSTLSLLPDTKYFLYVPEGQFWVYDSNNKRASEYSNAEVKFTYETPSVADVNLPPFEFATPVIGNHGSNNATLFVEDMELEYLDHLDIALKPSVKWQYNGKEYPICYVDQSGGFKYGRIYEITEDGDVPIKDFIAASSRRESTYEGYNVISCEIQSRLYEGKRYRIVIPAGLFTVAYPALYNYVQNNELSYTVTGTAPLEAKAVSCSIENGAELSELYTVVWGFNGEYDVAPDAKAIFKNPMGSSYDKPIYSSVILGKTYLTVNCAYETTGKPVILKDGQTASITLPAGILTYPTDESITNKEIVLNINGKTAETVVKPEFVSFSVSYMSPIYNVSPESDYNSSDYSVAYSVANDVVKGNSVTLKFDLDAWNIDHLMRFNGDSTTGTELKDFVENGVYTSSPLRNDTRFECVLSYNGDLVFSNSTGVAELDKLNVSVFSDGDNIMMTGLEGSERITVYTATGLTLGVHDAADNGNVQIAAPKGQVYIVRIQRGTSTQAARIMH